MYIVLHALIIKAPQNAYCFGVEGFGRLHIQGVGAFPCKGEMVSDFLDLFFVVVRYAVRNLGLWLKHTDLGIAVRFNLYRAQKPSSLNRNAAVKSGARSRPNAGRLRGAKAGHGRRMLGDR